MLRTIAVVGLVIVALGVVAVVGGLISRQKPILSLKDADLADAWLSEAILPNADLSEATLRYADLRDANLRRTNLRGADLREADLKGVDLSGADLRETNLSGATGLTNEELDQQAASLEGVTMPNGQKYEEWLKDKKAQGKDEKNE